MDKTRTTLCMAALCAAGTLTAASAATAAEGPASCAGLKSGSDAALGATGEVSAGPVSYVGMADAPGCTVSYVGTGAVFGSHVQAVAGKLSTMLTGEGWTGDINADADGPTGTATGFKRGGQAVAVSVSYDTAPGVCRDDQPSASCHPSPEQMRYTITLGLRPAS